MSSRRGNPFPSDYTDNEQGGFVGLMLILLALIIVGIILALYFTCTFPFNGSDSCKCANSKGTYKDGKCTCSINTTLKDKECVACPNGEISIGGECMCAFGKLRDTDGKCKDSSVNKTNHGDVLCPIGFSTKYDPSLYGNNIYCNSTTGLCDMCVSPVQLYPSKYVKFGNTLDWPERNWADPLEAGYDFQPKCTGGRTMGYQGGTYLTDAMPLNC